MKKIQRVQLLAYLAVVAIAIFGAYKGSVADKQAIKAQETARIIDRNGDLNLCRAENRIREKTNDRSRALEKTARLVKDALAVIAEAERSPEVNAELRKIARRAADIRTSFEPEKQSDCEARFEK